MNLDVRNATKKFLIEKKYFIDSIQNKIHSTSGNYLFSIHQLQSLKEKILTPSQWNHEEMQELNDRKQWNWTAAVLQEKAIVFSASLKNHSTFFTNFSSMKRMLLQARDAGNNFQEIFYWEQMDESLSFQLKNLLLQENTWTLFIGLSNVISTFLRSDAFLQNVQEESWVTFLQDLKNEHGIVSEVLEKQTLLHVVQLTDHSQVTDTLIEHIQAFSKQTQVIIFVPEKDFQLGTLQKIGTYQASD